MVEAYGNSRSIFPHCERQVGNTAYLLSVGMCAEQLDTILGSALTVVSGFGAPEGRGDTFDPLSELRLFELRVLEPPSLSDQKAYGELDS